MDLIILLSLLVNLVIIQGRTDAGPEHVFRPDAHTHFDVYANAMSRAHYNPWACDYRAEPGYKCLSCSSALHCYPGNFALLVQCAGIFPFCRNGYCSRFKTEGCIQEVDDPNTHIVNHSTMPPYVQTFHKDNKTSIVHDENLELNLPKPEDSISNAVTTEMDIPNKINGEITSTNAAVTSDTPNKIEKPKESTRVSEEMSSL